MYSWEKAMDEKIRKRQLAADGVQDLSGPIQPGVGKEAIDKSILSGDREANPITVDELKSKGGTNWAGAAAGAQNTIQTAQNDQSGGTQTLGAGVTAAGAATGNPYLLAGGLALSVVGAGEANKRKQVEAQRLAYNDRIKNRQELMQKIGSQGIQ